jgi:hypothetical protein
MIHYLETFFAFGIVGRGDVHGGFKLALGMVAEEGEDGDDGGGSDVKRQFVPKDGELLDEFRETLGEIGAVGM